MDMDRVFSSATDVNDAASIAIAGNIPVDSDDYQAYLHSKLNLACAAVALSRASFVVPQDSASLDCSLAANAPPQPGSQPLSKGPGHHPARSLDKEPDSVTANNKKADVPVRSGTSGSSIDQLDDDEIGETATTENMNPADAKRVRSKGSFESCIGLSAANDQHPFLSFAHSRMLSNRESARRSRKRKQAHLSELETQVSTSFLKSHIQKLRPSLGTKSLASCYQVAQLRVENSSLLKRLGNINQKFNEAAVDNRVLKADVETLRAKVKMAEETVKRLTGLNPMFHSILPEISPASTPSFDNNTSDAAVAATQDEPNKDHLYGSNPANPPSSSSQETKASDDFPEESAQREGAQAMPMQRVASLEHLQKRIRGNLGDN